MKHQVEWRVKTEYRRSLGCRPERHLIVGALNRLGDGFETNNIESETSLNRLRNGSEAA